MIGTGKVHYKTHSKNFTNFNMRIVIHAWSRKLKDKENPKNYPYWKELIEKLENSGHEIIQVGQEGEEALVDDFRKNLPFKELKKLIISCDVWIAIDSFFQHLAWRVGKKGIVLFGPSDPKIFGHEENINLFAGEEHFRPWQFGTWDECEHLNERFVDADCVIDHFYKYLKTQ